MFEVLLILLILKEKSKGFLSKSCLKFFWWEKIKKKSLPKIDSWFLIWFCFWFFSGHNWEERTPDIVESIGWLFIYPSVGKLTKIPDTCPLPCCVAYKAFGEIGTVFEKTMNCVDAGIVSFFFVFFITCSCLDCVLRKNRGRYAEKCGSIVQLVRWSMCLWTTPINSKKKTKRNANFFYCSGNKIMSWTKINHESNFSWNIFNIFPYINKQ